MSRGGRRAGAGRPVVAEHEKRVQLSISVSPKTKEWMQTQSREQGVTMGTILEGNLTGNKNQSTIAFAWDVPEQGPVKIELTLKALEQKPERLAKEYRDLLSMSLIDWQRLLMSLDVDIGFM